MLDRCDADLTGRERIVLEMLATPRTYAAIADELYVSINTVKSHVAHVYTKLGVTTRGKALQEARARGLLRDETHSVSTLASRGVVGGQHRRANVNPLTVYLLWQLEPDRELLLGVYASLVYARHALARIYDERLFEQRRTFRISACSVDSHRDATDSPHVTYEHPFADVVA